MQISCHHLHKQLHTLYPYAQLMFRREYLHSVHTLALCHTLQRSTEFLRDESRLSKSCEPNEKCIFNRIRFQMFFYKCCLQLANPACSLSSLSSWIFSTHFGIARISNEIRFEKVCKTSTKKPQCSRINHLLREKFVHTQFH